MKVDLKSYNRRQLEKLRADIDKALEKLLDVERKEALKAAELAAKAHGFSLAELTGAKLAASSKPDASAKKPARAKAAKSADGRAKVAPKYRNPENSEETWTGRGRAPKWVQAHLANGGSKDDLAI